MNDRSPPDTPDEPLGILFMCNPKYAGLIEKEHKRDRLMEEADRDGKLYSNADHTPMSWLDSIEQAGSRVERLR